MSQDKTSLVLAVVAGLTIGWFLGVGWWHVPGRFWGTFLALVLIIILIRRNQQGGKDAKGNERGLSNHVPSQINVREKKPDMGMSSGVDEVLSPEEARQWLDDLLVEQQKGEK